MCQCANYKEHGANATNAGSADANDALAGKDLKGGNSSPFPKKEGGGEKAPSPK